MSYKLALNKDKIAEYIGDSILLTLGIEAFTIPEYRENIKASFDEHKALITGISFSVEKGIVIYIQFCHNVGQNADFVKTWKLIQQNILMNEILTVLIHKD